MIYKGLYAVFCSEDDYATPFFKTKEEALQANVNNLLEMSVDDILDYVFIEDFEDNKDARLLKKKLEKAIGRKLKSYDDAEE